MEKKEDGQESERKYCKWEKQIKKYIYETVSPFLHK